jgi:hypothetical protein
VDRQLPIPQLMEWDQLAVAPADFVRPKRTRLGDSKNPESSGLPALSWRGRRELNKAKGMERFSCWRERTKRNQDECFGWTCESSKHNVIGDD